MDPFKHATQDVADPQRVLSRSGVLARIIPDTLSGGSVLEIAETEQSHVDLAEPQRLHYEYLHRIGALLTIFRPPGKPISVLHLGAGALTLARHLAVNRPGSRQIAVERERELPDFVTHHLPLPAGTDLKIVIGDVRWALPEVQPQGPYDAIVLDIFSGPLAPDHLTTPEYFAELAEMLAPRGVLVVNIGDDPGLRLVRLICGAVCSTLSGTALFGPQEMFSGRYPGNLVLAAAAPGTDRWPKAWSEHLTQAGPHPTQVLSGVELDIYRD